MARSGVLANDNNRYICRYTNANHCYFGNDLYVNKRSFEMKTELNKHLKLDIALIIICAVLACVFIGCIIVIALSGQPALEILAQCTPWFILVAVAIFFICIFAWMLRSDVFTAITLEEHLKERVEQKCKDALKQSVAQAVEGKENPDKRKTDGTTRKR